MACSQGQASQLAINGQAMEFNRFEDLSEIELVDNGDEASRGQLDHIEERVTQGLKKLRFRVHMQPSPAELDVILPLCGTTESLDVFSLAETLTAFDTIVDRVAKVHTYTDCYVDKAIFQGQKGRKPIGLILECVGTDLTEAAAGSFSATTITADIAYAFTEGVLTLEAAARAFDRFAFVWDNHLEVQFNNSQTADSICPADRTFHLGCTTPYTSAETALFTNPLASAAGAAGSLVWTRSTKSLTLDFANLKSIAKPPDIAGKTEIRLPQWYKIYQSGATKPLVITNDATA